MSSLPYSPRWREQLLALLDEAFGAEYHAYYVRQVDHWGRLAPEEMRLRTDETGERLVAYMLTAGYETSEDHGRYAYLYCVCTLKSRRGKGIMSHFVREECRRLCEEGYHGVALIPSSVGLVDFYAPLGFEQMETPIYHSAPLSLADKLLRPGRVVADYLASLPSSDPDYPVAVDADGGIRLCPPAGWMFLPLRPSAPVSGLLQPLT